MRSENLFSRPHDAETSCEAGARIRPQGGSVRKLVFMTRRRRGGGSCCFSVAKANAKKEALQGFVFSIHLGLAEVAGFEPVKDLRLYTLSKRAP